MLGVALLQTQAALAQSPFNPYGSFTDSGPVTPEEKARREQVRTDLYDRLSPAYRIEVPFVSEASIAGLQQAIERYRQIVANGGWPVTAQKVTLRQGDTSGDIATIRTHLIIEGDLGSGSGSNPTFDREFLDGLSRFQIRNGLRVSGFVDQRTLAALNVTANERLQQLETNLKRVQGLMSFNKAPRYVLVNVPFFVAQGVAERRALVRQQRRRRQARARNPAGVGQDRRDQFLPDLERAGDRRPAGPHSENPKGSELFQ